MQLFQEISQNMEASRLEETRKTFLRGFVGQKVLDPMPKCPIESMFWDWIFSYYPENEMSTVRFAGFSREYLSFVLDHKRFASDYLDWIQINETNIIRFASTSAAHRISVVDVMMYGDIVKRIIIEKLSCVTSYTVSYSNPYH